MQERADNVVVAYENCGGLKLFVSRLILASRLNMPYTVAKLWFICIEARCLPLEDV